MYDLWGTELQFNQHIKRSKLLEIFGKILKNLNFENFEITQNFRNYVFLLFAITQIKLIFVSGTVSVMHIRLACGQLDLPEMHFIYINSGKILCFDCIN